MIYIMAESPVQLHDSAILLRGSKLVDKQVFLLTFAEYLAENGHNVMYITEELSKIPPSLHGVLRKPEAFARIQFRYMKTRIELFEMLFDSSFYEKTLNQKYTVIVDSLEKYCEMPDLKDIARLSASLLGALPKVMTNLDLPRLVASLNVDSTIMSSGVLNCCGLFYHRIWDLDIEENIVTMKSSRGITNANVTINFDKTDLILPVGEQQLLKLKSILLTAV